MNWAAYSRFTAAWTSAERWRLPDFIDQDGGEIGLGAGEVADEFQQADGLGDPQCPAASSGSDLKRSADLMNVGAFLVGEVAFHQLEDFVQRHQGADGLAGKSRAIRHQHLVGLLDDRAVAAAVVPGSAGLEPNARHDPDAEVDVVRRIGVEVDEVVFADVGAAGGALQPQGGVQLP
jgi:hypothetical protein